MAVKHAWLDKRRFVHVAASIDVRRVRGQIKGVVEGRAGRWAAQTTRYQFAVSLSQGPLTRGEHLKLPRHQCYSLLVNLNCADSLSSLITRRDMDCHVACNTAALSKSCQTALEFW